MKVYILFSYHWDDYEVQGVYTDKDIAEAAEALYEGKLTRSAKSNGYGCYLEEYELIEGRLDDPGEGGESED